MQDMVAFRSIKGLEWMARLAVNVLDKISLHHEGAIVSPKSTLQVVQGVVWIGKFFNFQQGPITTVKDKWSILLAHWIQLVAHAPRWL